MKLAKTISIIVLAVLLSFSLFFNVFFISILNIGTVKSFKQLLLHNEIINGVLKWNTEDTVKPEDNTTVERPDEDNKTDNDSEGSEPDNSEKPVVDIKPSSSTVLYSANGVKITYTGKIETSTIFEDIELEVIIENTGDEAVTISFRDIFIDGYMSNFSSCYCDNLKPGKKAIEIFKLDSSDFEKFTDFPSVVEFVIHISNTETWGEIDESDPITIKICM